MPKPQVERLQPQRAQAPPAHTTRFHASTHESRQPQAMPMTHPTPPAPIHAARDFGARGTATAHTATASAHPLAPAPQQAYSTGRYTALRGPPTAYAIVRQSSTNSGAILSRPSARHQPCQSDSLNANQNGRALGRRRDAALGPRCDYLVPLLLLTSYSRDSRGIVRIIHTTGTKVL